MRDDEGAPLIDGGCFGRGRWCLSKGICVINKFNMTGNINFPGGVVKANLGTLSERISHKGARYGFGVEFVIGVWP